MNRGFKDAGICITRNDRKSCFHATPGKGYATVICLIYAESPGFVLLAFVGINGAQGESAGKEQ